MRGRLSVGFVLPAAITVQVRPRSARPVPLTASSQALLAPASTHTTKTQPPLLACPAPATARPAKIHHPLASLASPMGIATCTMRLAPACLATMTMGLQCAYSAPIPANSALAPPLPSAPSAPLPLIGS